MNKLLLMSIFTMVLLVLFGTLADITENPAGDVVSEPPTGRWVKSSSSAQWGWLPSEYSDTELDHAYPAIGTRNWIGMYFNPSLAENQQKSFQIFNMDTGKWEQYDNYAEFEAVYGASTVNPLNVQDIFDTNEFWLVLAGLLTGMAVLGIAIFGTGLSEWAQRMVFISGGYGALWLFLSAGTSDMLLEGALDIFGYLLYIGLTLTFIIGVIMETSGGGVD